MRHSPEELAALGLVAFAGSQSTPKPAERVEERGEPSAHQTLPTLVQPGPGLAAIPRKLADRIKAGEYVNSCTSRQQGEVQANSPGCGGPNNPGAGSRLGSNSEACLRPSYMAAMLCAVCSSSQSESARRHGRDDGLPNNYC